MKNRRPKVRKQGGWATAYLNEPRITHGPGGGEWTAGGGAGGAAAQAAQASAQARAARGGAMAPGAVPAPPGGGAGAPGAGGTGGPPPTRHGRRGSEGETHGQQEHEQDLKTRARKDLAEAAAIDQMIRSLRQQVAAIQQSINYYTQPFAAAPGSGMGGAGQSPQQAVATGAGAGGGAPGAAAGGQQQSFTQWISAQQSQVQTIRQQIADLQAQAADLRTRAAQLMREAKADEPDITKESGVATTLTAGGQMTYFSFPIEKVESTDDGDLYVYGKATDGSVDSDEQIVDPDWSAKALKEWLDSGGNVRVQHQAQRDPAGKGVDIEITPDGHYVKSLIVEPVAKRLVSKGVLTAYSVGIAHPQIMRDRVARGGRITGGRFVEISLVDRPANKNCGITLVKADDRGDPEVVGKMWGSPAAAALKAESETISIDLPSDVSVTFTPADLAKIVSRKQLLKNGSDPMDAEVWAHLQDARMAVHNAMEDQAMDTDDDDDDGDDEGKSASPDSGKGELTAARRAKIPRGDFAYVDSSGEGHLPIHDEAHVRNAMARFNQTHFESPDAKRRAARKITRRARSMGIEVSPDSAVARQGKGSAKKSDKSIELLQRLLAEVGAIEKPSARKRQFDPAVGGGVDRDKIPAEDFAGRNRSFPIVTPGDVSDAWHSLGRAGSGNYDIETLKRNIIRIARRKGPAFVAELPETAKETMKQDSVSGDGGIDTTMDQSAPGMEDSGPDAGAGMGPSMAGSAAAPAPSRNMELPDEVKTSLRVKAAGAPFELGMIHDFTCSAFHPGDVQKCYPGHSLASIDEAFWQQKALDAASAAPLQTAVKMTNLWGHAQVLKTSLASDAYVLQYEMHKAFQDANPGPSRGLSPCDMQPGRFNRPYVRDGHQHLDSSYDEHGNRAKVPTEEARASDYTRGYISDGHAQNSPGAEARSVDVHGPAQTGHITPASFGSVPRSNVAQAMRAMHDHIAQTFPDLCPMKPEGRPEEVRNPVPTAHGTPAAHAASSGADGSLKPVRTSEVAERQPTPAMKSGLYPEVVKGTRKKPKKKMPAWLQMLQDDDDGKGDLLPPWRRDDDDDDDDGDGNGNGNGNGNGKGKAAKAANGSEGLAPEDVEAEQEGAAEADENGNDDDDDSRLAGKGSPSPVTLNVQSGISKSDLALMIDALSRRTQQPSGVSKRELERILAPLMKREVAVPVPVPVSEKGSSSGISRKMLTDVIIPLLNRNTSNDGAVPREVLTDIILPILVKAQKQIPSAPAITRETIYSITAPLIERMDAQRDSARMAVREVTEPMMARLEAQERLIRRQEKLLRKQRRDETPSVIAPELSQDNPALAPNAVSKSEFADFASALMARLESQERMLRKQESRLRKQQLKAISLQAATPEPVIKEVGAPMPSPDLYELQQTRELLADITAKMEEQPGIAKDAVYEITQPLLERIDAQRDLLMARMEQQQEQRHIESMNDVTVAKQAVQEATGPLMARLEAQEKLIRKQEKALRKQREESSFTRFLAQESAAGSFGQSRPAPAMGASPQVVKAAAKLEKQNKKLQQKVKQQEAMLKDLPELRKAVDSLADLPDPYLAPFRGLAINKSQGGGKGGPAGSPSMTEVAERTQHMMLQELERQFRTSPDPAQREAAWRQITAMRGLSDKK